MLLIRQYLYRPSNWLSLVGILAVMPIVAYIVTVSWHTRYVADDYCTTASLYDLGWWQAQQYWYSNWSGRFSFTAAITALETLGLIVAQIIGPAILLVWIVGLTLLYKALAKLVGISLHALTPAIFLAIGTAVAFVMANPGSSQSFYWLTGNITYTLPLVLLSWSIYFVLKYLTAVKQLPTKDIRLWPTPSLAWLIAAAITVFVAAALNETFALYQLVMLLLAGLLGLLYRFFKKSRYSKIYLAAMSVLIMASLLSTTIMYLAPGNTVRASNYPPHPSLVETLQFAITATNEYILQSQQYIWFVYLFLATAAFYLLVWPNAAKTNSSTTASLFRAVIAAIITAYGLCVVVHIPSFYMQHFPPGQRIISSIPFTLSALAIYLGYIFARHYIDHRLLSNRVSHQTAGVAIVLVVFVHLVANQAIPVSKQLQQQLPRLQSYAQQQDHRHNYLINQRNLGHEQVSVYSFGKIYGLEDATDDPRHWLNRCMADYYGLHSLTGHSDANDDNHNFNVH